MHMKTTPDPKQFSRELNNKDLTAALIRLEVRPPEGMNTTAWVTLYRLDAERALAGRLMRRREQQKQQSKIVDEPLVCSVRRAADRGQHQENCPGKVDSILIIKDEMVPLCAACRRNAAMGDHGPDYQKAARATNGGHWDEDMPAKDKQDIASQVLGVLAKIANDPEAVDYIANGQEDAGSE